MAFHQRRTERRSAYFLVRPKVASVAAWNHGGSDVEDEDVEIADTGVDSFDT
jgi:hypothetical protein